jgi:hypothetical protein
MMVSKTNHKRGKKSRRRRRRRREREKEGKETKTWKNEREYVSWLRRWTCSCRKQTQHKM